MQSTTRLVLVLCAFALLPLAPSFATDVDKTVPFELDKWYDLGVKDGTVTLHRFQIERQRGEITKSSFLRPGNTEFLESVRLLIEYSNSSKNRDWKADLDVTWVDGSGEVIDGYRDDETVQDDESRELITVTLSTLKFGLKRAKSIHFKVHLRPE